MTNRTRRDRRGRFVSAHNRHVGGTIKWIVAHMHVYTPYEDVAADIAERIAERGDPNWTRATVARMYTDALIAHRRNRTEYEWIMGGLK